MPPTAYSPITGSSLSVTMQADSSFFVGWGTLALINAGIAQGKNRSGLGWFLISLLTGPVGTLLLVLCENRPADTRKT